MDLTTTIYAVCDNVGGSLGSSPFHISLHSLQYQIEMLLLLNNIDSDTILPIGRWNRYEILIYLHITVWQLVQGHITMMVYTG